MHVHNNVQQCIMHVQQYRMDLASALSTEGPLEKQSPNVLKIYQTRYFAIRGKGQFLVWFKKKPVNPDQDPKGILKIQTISQIVQGGDDKYFSIVYLQRTFNFRAQSVPTKQRWVKALQTILAHFQKHSKNKLKPQQNTAESWKWKNNTNQQISEQIRLQNQEVILTDASSEIGKKSQDFLAKITKDKSIFEIEKCIVYGYFMKKKMVGSSERWYFLASGVNLKDDKDEELYTATEQFLQQLKAPKQEEKQVAKKKEDSSDSQQQVRQQKKQNKNMKQLRINCLFEYDVETKLIKYCYNVVDMISYQLKTSEQPFELKITYEQATDNQQDEQIKQNQIILMSNFLIQVKKLHSALKIISQKYNMHKLRQQKNANKSKRYAIKRWRHLSQDQWRVAEQKNSLYVLLNKKMVRINAIGINLQTITSHSKQSIKIKGTEQSNNNGEQSQLQKQKKQQVLYLTYKKEQEQLKVYIQFDSLATLNKFNKKLGRNIKKMQEQIEAESRDKIMNRKQEEKKVNENTYLIDKKIRETSSAIKVNFYEMMDRELVAEKKEDIKEKGFFDKIMTMFCALPSSFQTTTPAATANK